MSTKCCDCCHPELVNSEFCGCCEGIEVLTPLPTANRPGLSQLAYRIGTHSSFLESMMARLSSKDFPELKALTTRESDDPSIALLDVWATVADVLTFYQERIANEGYLRTAVERRSILELAKLVGYKLRPGVASSVFLAYTIDQNTQEEVTIPAGSRAQSVPGPGERPQPFETSEALKARAKWNNLQPRLTRPQTAASIKNDPSGSEQVVQGPRIYLKGISTNLKPNDPLLIDFGADVAKPEPYRVKEVRLDVLEDRALVILQGKVSEIQPPEKPVDLIGALTLPPSTQPPNSQQLKRNLKMLFVTDGVGQSVPGIPLASTAASVPPSTLLRKTLAAGDASYTVLKAFTPALRDNLANAVEKARVTEQNPIKVYALRLKTSLFGHNAPRQPQYEPTLIQGGGDVGLVPNPDAGNLKPQPWDEWKPDDDESAKVLYLDRFYDEILPGSYVAIQELNSTPSICTIENVQSISRSAYGISAETTKLTLDQGWWKPEEEDFITKLRTTTVFAQSEELELTEEPINSLVCGGTDKPIELDGFYEGLESGRWVIICGERDIDGTSGVRFSELAMLATVKQDIQKIKINEKLEEELAGDKLHTYIKFAEKLQYCFKRDTVKIYGNVVKATHGETRKEVLGSGDASKALQSFELKQAPLTFVPASNPSGVDSTLNVFVNDVRWHEADSLVGLQPNDRSFITKTNDEQKTTVIFGNGTKGARPPTGTENIQAEYRSGIGKPGNVRADQITLLATKPLGVKEVINPLRASGGADRESRDQARKNAPLAVKALDRLVSVQDYEDFARVYAGIGKAMAVELSDGRRQLVHVTIAGADDIPIDEHSDLFQNLRQALHDFGDPFQPIQLVVRELMLIVISAKVRILPDYRWEPVATQLQAALWDAFSFEHRELGQDVLLSEVISVMQKVRGVAYVDVDVLGGIPEKIQVVIEEKSERRLLTPDEITKTVRNFLEMRAKTNRPEQRIVVNRAGRENGAIRPAQLAFLSPEVSATLNLNRIE